MNATLPRARKAGLVTRKLRDEVLVYDLDRHRASCLNRTAALVWRHCDGRTSASALIPKLQAEIGAAVDEKAVWLALDRLCEAHLLEDEGSVPVAAAGSSRREWLRELGRLGVRAALLPAVVSILAPTVADAQTALSQQQCRDRSSGGPTAVATHPARREGAPRPANLATRARSSSAVSVSSPGHTIGGRS